MQENILLDKVSDKKTKVILFVTLILPVLGLLFYYSSCSTQYKRLDIFGPKELSSKGDTIYHTIEPFKFISQSGDTITESITKGKIYIADYFFTTCKTICPLMSKHLEKVQKEFEKDDQVIILSHTVDPETDSVPVLAQYAKDHHAQAGKWYFLTGDKPELYALARNSYFLSALTGDGGPEDFIHSEKLVLVDKEKRIRGFYDGTDTKDVKRLIDEIEVLKIEYGDRK